MKIMDHSKAVGVDTVFSHKVGIKTPSEKIYPDSAGHGNPLRTTKTSLPLIHPLDEQIKSMVSVPEYRVGEPSPGVSANKKMGAYNGTDEGTKNNLFMSWADLSEAINEATLKSLRKEEPIDFDSIRSSMKGVTGISTGKAVVGWDELRDEIEAAIEGSLGNDSDAIPMPAAQSMPPRRRRGRRGYNDDEKKPWTCSQCTFVNSNPLHLTCEICNWKRLS